MRIAFLGLGAMGRRMAMSIVRDGHDVTVWNRSPGKADDLVHAGAKAAATPRKAADGAEIVVSMVLDDDASRAVWTDEETGALAGMAADAVAVECSTISVGWCRDLAAIAGDQGIAMIEAPVAGTLGPAESGDLIIIAGGSEAAIARARPALDAMGKVTHRAGDSGAGAMTKLLVNGLLATQMAQLAELLGTVGKLGVDRQAAFDILCHTPVASDVLRSYGQMMLDGADAVNFPVSHIIKDLDLIAATADSADAAHPVARASRDSFRAAAEAGLADRNTTEILRIYE